MIAIELSRKPDGIGNGYRDLGADDRRRGVSSDRKA